MLRAQRWTRRARHDCARTPATICGCTSRACASYRRRARCRSSSAGDGCYVEDVNGKRYLDALAGLFAVRSATRTARRSGRRRRSRCGSCRSTRTGPTRIRARSSWRRRSPSSRPGTSTASSSARAGRRRSSRRGSSRASTTRPAASGAGRRSRGDVAYHGTTMGALSINGIAALRDAVRAAGAAESLHVRNTNRYRRPPEGDRGGVHGLPARRPRGRRSTPTGPGDGRDGDHGAGAERRRRVHSRLRATGPGRARDLRPVRDPAVRRRGDHRLRKASGPGSAPSATTSARTSSPRAKGLSSAHASIGAVIASDRVMEPFLDGHRDVHARDHLRRPSRAGGDRARRTSRSCGVSGSSSTSSRSEDAFRATLEQLLDAPDRRRPPRDRVLLRARARQGQGDTRRPSRTRSARRCCRGFLSPRLFDAGLICRADDRGDPVVQISPPLVAEQAQFDEIDGDPRRGARRGLGAARPLAG